MRFSWLKGHGTENDFVLLPDHDGSIHGDLDPAFVAAICQRRRGIGADGVIRVIRTADLPDPAFAGQPAEWFMDYRNADGSISEMCGNGIRVFALHLKQEGLIDADSPVAIGSRDGVKTVTFQGAEISVDMGTPEIFETTKVQVDERVWEAKHIETGNPHAVAFIERLADAGTLLEEPGYDREAYPKGVNIEFVVRAGERHVAMRVHERGSGETQSCGTGACAVGVATALADSPKHSVQGGAPTVVRPATYRVDVPGGTVQVTWTEDNHMILTGPAEIVARGEMEWLI